MVNGRASWPYRAAAVVLLLALVAIDTLAKLGPLGNWSALFDVSVSLVLIIAAVTAVVIGERKDRAARNADADNDY